jgi:hypothetical protein
MYMITDGEEGFCFCPLIGGIQVLIISTAVQRERALLGLEG